MDADELARIIAALQAAVGAARVTATAGAKVHHEVLRHAREMHDILLAAIVRHSDRDAAELRGYVEATRAAIRELEALAGTSLH